MANHGVNVDQVGEAAPQKKLRLWLGGVAVGLWLLRFVIPKLGPDNPTMFLIPVGTGLLGEVVFIVWWVFFSREPRAERWAAFALMIVAEFTASRLLHKSIAASFAALFLLYSIPILVIVFAIWAVFSLRLSDRSRRATMVVTILLASAVMPLLRTDGIIGFSFLFASRWSKTPEERLLAESAAALPEAPAPVKNPAKEPEPEKVAPAPTPVTTPSARPKAAPTKVYPAAEWPGFRGPKRDSIIPGIEIKTDWSASPPVELWRRPVGPG